MICKILNKHNLNSFRNYLNNKMMTIYGVNDWIERWEIENKNKLENFIGKYFNEIEEIICYIDRDCGDNYF